MSGFSPLELDIRHHCIRINRFESIGDWLLKAGKFLEWSRGEGGSGKGILFSSGSRQDIYKISSGIL